MSPCHRVCFFPHDFVFFTAILGPYNSLLSVRETSLHFSEQVCLFFHGKLLKRCVWGRGQWCEGCFQFTHPQCGGQTVGTPVTMLLRPSCRRVVAGTEEGAAGAGVRAGLQRPRDSGRVRQDSGRVRRARAGGSESPASETDGTQGGLDGWRWVVRARLQRRRDSVRLRRPQRGGSVHGPLGAQLACRRLACPSRRQGMLGNELGSRLVFDAGPGGLGLQFRSITEHLRHCLQLGL